MELRLNYLDCFYPLKACLPPSKALPLLLNAREHPSPSLLPFEVPSHPCEGRRGEQQQAGMETAKTIKDVSLHDFVKS
ncbi:hypothetical protein Taro_018456 [Colocasia esculenta]|uniref:Uncharacterized protein n=1 Tax=Colocasia esculenta TaxID=4460 RepID=A0A843UTX1_COLES|nr:hypothetical protein [Colocasia esculenta]